MASRARSKSRKTRKTRRRYSRRTFNNRVCLVEPLEDRRLLAADVLFADSFESGATAMTGQAAGWKTARTTGSDRRSGPPMAIMRPRLTGGPTTRRSHSAVRST